MDIMRYKRYYEYINKAVKMNKKQVIEKIKKLLSLANSDNEHEAQIASERAQALLLKHNITQATVDRAQAEFVGEKFEFKRKPVEMKFIHSILGQFFFIEIVYSRHKGHYQFFGTEENVQTALYVEGFLNNAFKRLYKIEAKKQGWSHGKNKNAFFLGVYKGLSEKLESQKEKMVPKHSDNEKALMIVNKQLTSFVQNQFSKLRTESNRRINANPDAVAAGREQGRKLNIARGLGSTNQTNGTLALKGGS